jgi:hypothetical protein
VFVRLEQVVPLKGNQFYATFDPKTREHRACGALGLPEFALDVSVCERQADGRLR